METAIKLGEKIRSGRLVLGTWMQIPHIIVAELIAQIAFDFVLMDGEHSPISPDTLHALLPATDKFAMPVLYRVRANSADQIKAALDSGVAGLMVPMINSAKEAEQAVAASKYPPLGTRGIGAWRASNYFQDDMQYLRRANQTPVIIQIETRAALEAVETIAKVPGIDALYVGPADLSTSLGLPLGQLGDGLKAACRRVANAAQKYGLVAGVDVGSLDYVAPYRELGFSLMTYGLDTSYLLSGGRDALAALRSAAE